MTAEDNEEVEIPERVNRLLTSVQRFRSAIEALEEMVDVLGPEAARLDDPLRGMSIKTGGGRLELSSEQKDFVRSAADEFFSEEMPDFDPEFKHFGHFMRVATDAGFTPDEAAGVYFAVGASTRRFKRIQLLLSSMLTSAVGSFEVMVGAGVRYFYEARPSALIRSDRGDKEFSLADLESFESIQDARELAIDRRVDAFLFESFPAWSEWFKKQLSYGFDEISTDWPMLREIIERRHIVVHNGGRVSRRYLGNIQATEAELPIGTVLVVDERYLRHAMDELLLVGTVATLVAIIHLDKVAAELAVGALQDECYGALLRRKWSLALAFGTAGLKLNGEQNSQLIFQVNVWIAQDRMGLDIEPEVRSFDASALDVKFRIAKAVLLGEMEHAFELIDDWTENSGLAAYRALCEWPLFQPIRRDARFKSALANTFEVLNSGAGDPPPKFEVVVPVGPGRFHRPTCRHVNEGAFPVRVVTAVEMGLEACGSCRPAGAEIDGLPAGSTAIEIVVS